MEIWTDIKRVDDDAERVTKFVFSNATAVAEAVLYRYPTYAERTVICISTQSGCPVGCRFCGAGDAFVRSLTADEIVAQAAYCLQKAYEAEGALSADMGRLQIMFMSMGEPLLNLKGLAPAIRRLYADYPNAALLISTSAPSVDYAEVRALSAEAALRASQEALRAVEPWLTAALKCRSWSWDADQQEAATEARDAALQALSLQGGETR